VARRTREHCGHGCGHNATVDNPAAKYEPPEDRDIHRAKSPTPAPMTFTRGESTTPPPTPSHSATTSHAPFLMIPQTSTHRSKLREGDLGIPAPQMRRIRPRRSAPNHTTNLHPRPTLPPEVGEAVEGVTEYEVERSCHFPIISFTQPQKFQLHTSWTSHILYIFVFLSPV